MTLVKNRRTDFILRDYYDGVMQSGRYIRLNSEYKDKWTFIVKEQGRSQWIKGH